MLWINALDQCPGSMPGINALDQCPKDEGSLGCWHLHVAFGASSKLASVHLAYRLLD